MRIICEREKSEHFCHSYKSTTNHQLAHSKKPIEVKRGIDLANFRSVSAMFSRYFIPILLISTFLLGLTASAEGARERDTVKMWQHRAAAKQWDGSFPYFLMMMSSSSNPAAVPSVWLIPVILASCLMFFIRGTMEWI